MTVDRVVCTPGSPGPIATLTVVGRLDTASSAVVRTALHDAVATSPAALAVDLSRLTIGDHVALIVFPVFSRAVAAWPGCRTLLYAPDERLRRTLERMSATYCVSVHDDWELLLGDARSQPAPRHYQLRLPPRADSAAAAREQIRAICQEWHLDALGDDAEVVVTELVANAVGHAPGEILLTVVVGPRLLHLGVRDGSAALPHRRLPDPDTGRGGRGLLLIEAVAGAWGTAVGGGGKTVWATLRRPGR